jgi:hypothetical protein
MTVPGTPDACIVASSSHIQIYIFPSMKNTRLPLLITLVFLSNHHSLHAQISITTPALEPAQIDSARSIFGMNAIRYEITNTLPHGNTTTRIRLKRTEFREHNREWCIMPDLTSHEVCAGDYISLVPYRTEHGLVYVPLFNLYLDESIHIKSFATSGGTVDYRLVFDVDFGKESLNSFYSPVIHIVVPPATRQDKAAFKYMQQQKTACPEVEYLFSDVDRSTLRCFYIYQYLAAHCPDSMPGKVSKYKIALRNCLNHRNELPSMPGMKKNINDTCNELNATGIKYLQDLAHEMSCADY